MSRRGKAEGEEGVKWNRGISHLNCCQAVEICYSERLWKSLQFLGTESMVPNGEGQLSTAVEAIRLLPERLAEHKCMWDRIMCDYGPPTSSKRTYAEIGDWNFSCMKKRERPSVKVAAQIEDYREQHLSLLTLMEMLLRMSSAHIWLSNFPLDVG